MTIYFLTGTTQNCAYFIGSLLVLHFLTFLLIIQICTIQWLNCKNLKDELNRTHNGGGVLYLLQSELSYSTMQYTKWSIFKSYLKLSKTVWLKNDFNIESNDLKVDTKNNYIPVNYCLVCGLLWISFATMSKTNIQVPASHGCSPNEKA